MGEFAPAGRTPKMTRNQVIRYQREMEEKRQKAKEELKEAEENGELKKQKDELENIENKLDDMFF